LHELPSSIFNTKELSTMRAKPEQRLAGAKQHRNLSRTDEILRKIEPCVAAGHYAKAVALLSSVGADPQLLNAKGVCLLRMGKYDEAVRLYKNLVLTPGCTWMRRDLPTVYKTNYATALLLSGRPGGSLEMLDEIGDEQNPTVRRLRSAIQHWEARLSLWQRLNWRFGRIAPSNRPLSIDFEAGDFERFSTSQDAPCVGPRRSTALPTNAGFENLSA
jgi:tetratricopeptide (TPR) repeat protein